MKPFIQLLLEQNSGSQREYREKVTGVPPSFGFTRIPSQIYDDMQLRMTTVFVLTQSGTQDVVNFFILKGKREPKSVEKHCY